MKLPYLLSLAALLLLTTGICRAQAPESQLNLKTPPPNIVVDGDIKEWNDSLTYYSPEERLNYMLSNTKDTLYLAVKIYDRAEIARIINAGLTFSIDPKGKKKETFSVTYPVNVQGGSPMAFIHKQDEDGITQEDRDELLREKLTTLRGIKVSGFSKDIDGDMITTSNTYGIQSAINYDAAGNLIYEEAIPMQFFHADLKGEWAFNLKINGIQRPQQNGGEEGGGGGGGRHGGGGGGMGGGGGRHGGGGGHKGGGSGGEAGGGEMFKSVDFWGKFSLAK